LNLVELPRAADLEMREMAGADRIDVHHHILPEEYLAALSGIGQTNVGDVPFPKWEVTRTLEVMDAHGIATAITSISAPGVHFGDAAFARPLARRCNELSARLMGDHPRRFGALATLPLPDVEGALLEAEYAFDTLGLDGAVLLASAGGRYLGDPEFDDLFSELNRRRAVVFIHPTVPPGSQAEQLGIPAPILEFIFDTTRAVANLIASGTLERCPEIRFILSHAGGAVPYLALRLSLLQADPGFLERAPRGVVTYLQRLYYDTALSATPHALRSLQELVAPSQILFGSDYPFAPEPITGASVAGLDAYDGFDDAARRAIYRENALSLFPRLRE
jgi:predicted TIM-barrel fold metal-dependent hydrolase